MAKKKRDRCFVDFKCNTQSSEMSLSTGKHGNTSNTQRGAVNVKNALVKNPL